MAETFKHTCEHSQCFHDSRYGCWYGAKKKEGTPPWFSGNALPYWESYDKPCSCTTTVAEKGLLLAGEHVHS